MSLSSPLLALAGPNLSETRKFFLAFRCLLWTGSFKPTRENKVKKNNVFNEPLRLQSLKEINRDSEGTDNFYWKSACWFHSWGQDVSIRFYECWVISQVSEAYENIFIFICENIDIRMILVKDLRSVRNTYTIQFRVAVAKLWPPKVLWVRNKWQH